MAELSKPELSELFHLSLIQSLPGAIAAADNQGRMLFVNAAFCKLVGWSEEELVGQKIPFSFWPSEDIPEMTDSFRRLRVDLSEGRRSETVARYCHRNGERFPIRLQLSPLCDAKGQAIGSTASVEDLRRTGEFEQLLRERELFFERIVGAAPGFLYIFDLRKTINVFTNRHLAESLGYAPEYIQELGATFLAKLMHPEDFAALSKLFARWDSVADKQVVNTEYRLRSAAGDYRWYLSRDTTFRRDEKGKVVQIIGLAQDITSRKKAEAAQQEAEHHLRESEHRYRLLADHATDMIYRLGPNGAYLDVSPACARMIGFKPNELAGRLEYELVHTADRDRVFNFHSEIISEKSARTISYRLRGKHGAYIWIETHAQPILDPSSLDVVELLAVSRDVTDRMNAQEALRRSEELFRTLVERSSDGIALVELDGHIRYLSPAAGRILGHPHTELGEIDVRTFLIPEEHPALMKAALDHLGIPGATYCTHVRARNRNGTLRHLEVVVSNHLDDQYIRAYVVNFRDVSGQIELEEQLRQAQKMEAVGQLAGGIAHDFNNILTAIIGNVSLMMDASATDDPNWHTLAAIDKAAKRAAELTSRLLGYSRRTALHVSPVDPNRVVEESLKLLRPTIDPRIVFDLQLDPTLWPALADADQLSQVLTNLCLNARDAMPRGGRLAVKSANALITDEYVKSHVIAQPGDYVHISVQDTGAGMPPEVQSRVFEPFFTTKPTGAGTGLGLAMVYGILKSHGGWVTCDSAPGFGTRMDLYLPRSLEPVEERRQAGSDELIRSEISAGETVLLVDDEAAIRTLGRIILEQHGFHVLLAEDGVEAIETFRESADRVALVILDLTMPNMSGQDTFRRMREIAPGIRVLFSSGYSADHLGEVDAGVGFINKPYRPAELLEAVRSHVRRIGDGFAQPANQ